jgi:hypothetical protein
MYPNGNPTRCLAVTEHEDAELCESEPNKKRAAGFFTTTGITPSTNNRRNKGKPGLSDLNPIKVKTHHDDICWASRSHSSGTGGQLLAQ